jgi:hypothetical protein
MKNSADIGDYMIVLFIGVIFIAGGIVVYKFMRAGKKK